MKTYFSICFVIIAILTTSAFCLAGAEKNHVCFKIVDADKDGKVTFQEFKQFFDDGKEKFGAIIESKEVAEAFRKMFELAYERAGEYDKEVKN